MKFSFFKKIVPIIIIISLVFGLSADIFVKKTKAQTVSTTGQAVGKALAAGAACFLGSKLEAWGYGLITRTTAIPEGYAQMAKYPTAVPTVVLNNPAVAMSVETSNALTQSKDCIRDVIAKILLDWIVDQTVQWIQNGGEPMFVTNWQNFLSDAANVAIGGVIEQTLPFLCSPFKLQVQLSMQRFQQPAITCTLDKIVSNIENFYNDFTSGGWVAYTTAWQPQNNYYGATLMAYDQMLIQSAAAQRAAQNEALAGGGFLSSKNCKGGGYSLSDFENNTPPSMYVKDSKGKYCTPDKIEVITPASIVGQAAATAITSDSAWAANIKSWVAALVNAIIVRLAKQGLSLMAGSQTSDSSGDFDPYSYYNKHTLTTATDPSDGGTISGVSSDGTYDSGTYATITATASNGYVFSIWSGDATGTNLTTQVLMDTDKFVIANFSPQPKYALTITVNPSNAGTISGAGVYDAGQYAFITATSTYGYVFNYWSGDATSTSPTTQVLMDKDKSVIANFSP